MTHCPPAAQLHVRHGEPRRRPDGGKSVSLNGRLPLGVGRIEQVGPRRAGPTLLTRTSSPPNASTVRSITSAIPSGVDTSACTAITMFGRRAAASTASAAAPRAAPATRADTHPAPLGDALVRSRAQARGSIR